MKYRSEIDGLRAIAVISVILFHAGFSTFSGGFVGVDVFFVISGYLITTIILSEMEEGSFSLVNFYERRARRILPILFFVMTITLIFGWLWFMPYQMQRLSESLLAVSSIYSNILFGLNVEYWDIDSQIKPLLHTWSLAVEEQYYILFPLFITLMWRWKKYLIFGALLLIGGISLATAQWGAFHYPNLTFYLLPTRAWELVIGAAIAFYFLYGKETIKPLIFHQSLNDLFSIIGLFMIVYAIFGFNENIPFPSLYTLIPTIGTALIIVFASSETIIGRLLSIKPLVVIGLISYSLYLWHQPLFAFARDRISHDLNYINATILIFILLPLAYLSWQYVEKPFRNKNIFDQKAIFIFSLVGLFSFAGIGLLGHFNHGYKQRNAYQKLLVYNYEVTDNIN